MFAFNSYHHPMIPGHQPQPQPHLQNQNQYQGYYDCNTQPLGFNCYNADSMNSMNSMNPNNTTFMYNNNMNMGIAGNNNHHNQHNMYAGNALASSNIDHSNVNNINNQPNGGVASVLDYDLDQMVKFLSWVTFGLVRKSLSPSLAFQKSINSVLSATRLPKSTLLLAINYLSNKMDDDLSVSSSSSAYINYNEDEIFKILITALILSNKFNDDKTFRNKSWSDATNLPLFEINKLERSWLMDCNYELFKTNSFSMVESCWNTWCIKNIQSIDNTSSVGNANANANANANVNNIHHNYNPPATFATNPLIAPLTPISTNPSSPVNPSCCYYDNNTIPTQIFKNPFQNINHAESVMNNQHQPHPSLIVSPGNDFPYVGNDYLEMSMNNTSTKSSLQIPHEDLPCYNNSNPYCSNSNNMQTINPHHLEYENDQIINYDMNNSYNYGLDYIYNGYSNYGCFNGYNYCAATAC